MLITILEPPSGAPLPILQEDQQQHATFLSRCKETVDAAASRAIVNGKTATFPTTEVNVAVTDAICISFDLLSIHHGLLHSIKSPVFQPPTRKKSQKKHHCYGQLPV